MRDCRPYFSAEIVVRHPTDPEWSKCIVVVDTGDGLVITEHYSRFCNLNISLVFAATSPQGQGSSSQKSDVEELGNPAASTSSTSAKQKDVNGIHCPICFDTLDQVKATNNQMHSTICGHLFCGPCITKVIANTNQCPTCRQVLDMRKIHPIFI